MNGNSAKRKLRGGSNRQQLQEGSYCPASIIVFAGCRNEGKRIMYLSVQTRRAHTISPRTLSVHIVLRSAATVVKRSVEVRFNQETSTMLHRRDAGSALR